MNKWLLKAGYPPNTRLMSVAEGNAHILKVTSGYTWTRNIKKHEDMSGLYGSVSRTWYDETLKADKGWEAGRKDTDGRYPRLVMRTVNGKREASGLVRLPHSKWHIVLEADNAFSLPSKVTETDRHDDFVYLFWFDENEPEVALGISGGLYGGCDGDLLLGAVWSPSDNYPGGGFRPTCDQLSVIHIVKP